MKFRQFEFRFFQKIRGRRKKKQKYSDTSIPIDDNCNYTRTSGCYDNPAIDHAACSISQVNSPVESQLNFDSPLSASDVNQYFYTYSRGVVPLSELNIAVPAQCHYENCHGCGYYDSEPLSSSGGVPIICLSEAESTPLGTPHTIPKTRSRIKTNPWLPSPRTTPSASPTGTVESILFGSTDLVGSMSSGVHYDLLQKECAKLNSLIKIGESETGSDEAEAFHFDNDYVFRANVNSRKKISLPDLFEDTDRSSRSTPVLETIEILGDINYQISFKYEEEVDDLLENNNIPRDETFLSIKDLIEDDYGNACAKEHETTESLCPSEVKNVSPEVSVCDDVIISMTSEEDIVSHKDLTFYDECYMQESIDTGYASVTREDELYSSEEEFESIEDEYEWDDEPCAQSLQCYDYGIKKSLNKNFDTMSESGDTVIQRKEKRRSRSLADIELSLDEKVTQLREEKLLVQRKILEAQEEEKIRRKQLRRFQTQPIINRKEVLLQTLHDLKTRLENQSVRLQASYDTVLAMQKKFSKRRLTLPFIETPL